ncbi:conserved hypothetical protein [Theileria orientalis strain Shintoku]|uniref:Uncharacterized protein n=1 Tax=Theileria orientalis strain Shintoku TaxID=869250 RepID=J4D9K5_THEOR|nr:conserved hypothetical protein [Theileria orientalis strain Shintoku]BAM41440.1 conserved hypothetical protein [Theileria orientalis strain Shintoku]|eukprot:XP_009691741.1 conserved hypothetical protein [Theileria orientalis strain Shintoku]
MRFYVLLIICCFTVSNSTDLNANGKSTPDSYFINLLNGSQLNYNSSDPHNLKLDLAAETHRYVHRESNDHGETVTNTYTVDSGYMIREVTDGSSKVWRCTDSFGSAKAVTQIVKKGLTQLVTLRNDDTELYFKRQKTSFVQVPRSSDFEELKRVLEAPGRYVETWVELDLSRPVPNPLYFSNELIYHDGVPKFEVKTLDPFQVYRVYDSGREVNSLSNNLECKHLFFYVFEQMTLLEVVHYSPGATPVPEEVKYFKKESTWDSITKEVFDAKYQELKAKIVNVDFEFDLVNTRSDKLYKRVNKIGEYTYLSLYPKTGHHLKKLLYDNKQVSALGEEERFSPLVLHLADKKTVMIGAQVWKGDKVLKWLYFVKSDLGFLSIDTKTYESKLSEMSTNQSLFDETLEYVDSGSEEDTDSSDDEDSDSDSDNEEDKRKKVQRRKRKRVPERRAPVHREDQQERELYRRYVAQERVVGAEEVAKAAKEVEVETPVKVEEVAVVEEEPEEEEEEVVDVEELVEDEDEEAEEALAPGDKRYDSRYDSLLYSLLSVKFRVRYDVDEKYFSQVKSTDGEFEVHTVTPRDNYFVNLVDSKHGVVWKAKQHSYQATSLVVYFKSESPRVLKVHMVGPNVDRDKYFMLSRGRWVPIGLTGFHKLLNKHEQSLNLFS